MIHVKIYCIEYTFDFGDEEGIIMRNIGDISLLLRKQRDFVIVKHLYKSKTLRYNDNVKIWRNY